MVNPKFKGGKTTMFICGNDEAAKKAVVGIPDQFGWEVLDMGKVEAARAIEPLCMLWCIPGLPAPGLVPRVQAAKLRASPIRMPRRGHMSHPYLNPRAWNSGALILM
jgi:hypothetical protein